MYMKYTSVLVMAASIAVSTSPTFAADMTPPPRREAVMEQRKETKLSVKNS